MRSRTNQRIEWVSCYYSFCKMLGYWISLDCIPKNLPKSVSDIEMQNQMDKSIKYKEIGITPILLLHHSEVPLIVLHRHMPTYPTKIIVTTTMPVIWEDRPMRIGWHSKFAPYQRRDPRRECGSQRKWITFGFQIFWWRGRDGSPFACSTILGTQ